MKRFYFLLIFIFLNVSNAFSLSSLNNRMIVKYVLKHPDHLSTDKFLAAFNLYYPLYYDFLNLYKKRTLADYRLADNKIHKGIVCMAFGRIIKRANLSLEKVLINLNLILERLSRKKQNIFIYWLYTSDYTYNNENLILNVVGKLFEKLKLHNDFNLINFVSERILTDDLKELYCDENEKDFFICVNNIEIPIHKFVLIARTGLFRNMFLYSYGDDKFADLSGLDIPAYKTFIFFLYHNYLPNWYMGNLHKLDFWNWFQLTKEVTDIKYLKYQIKYLKNIYFTAKESGRNAEVACCSIL